MNAPASRQMDWPQSKESSSADSAPQGERRHFTHKRMERWIRLQQFVFGLPDDYSYAICTTQKAGGEFRSRTLVKVGWMSWYGDGIGGDRQHSLSVSLLDAAEALSANSSTVFWHSVSKWVKKGFRRVSRNLRAGKLPVSSPADTSGMSAEEKQLELLAG
ncbi:MAG: hypothetical protein EOP11_07615 [Proteobacteria bacterium]|nr:MAG: hypothetical protein EOP11_07615 [Pseudomonadota bacterium]